MIRRPQRSTRKESSAASDVYKRQIKGTNFDGHNFLNEVIKKGVKAVVIKDGMQNLLPNKFPFWIVPDTLEAFQKLALFKRKKLNMPVVGITGSVGKTTTKEMMGEVLKQLGKIKLTQLNYNNEIGVRLVGSEMCIRDRYNIKLRTFYRYKRYKF